MEKNLKNPLSILSKLFNKNPGIVYKEIEGYEFINGRKPFFKEEELEIIFEEVKKRILIFEPFDYKSLQIFIKEKLQIDIDISSLRSIIKKSSKLKIIKGVPIESKRIDIKKRNS